MQGAEKRQEVRFLVATTALVAILAIASFQSVMSIPRNWVEAERARQPASLQPTGEDVGTVLANRSRLEALTWECGTTDQRAETLGTHVRLSGPSHCEKQKLRELKITNASNGFTATVFINEKGFLTDYIDLQPGENQLTIEWKEAKGKVASRQLTVERK